MVVRGWKYGIKISEKKGTIAPGVALRLRVPLDSEPEVSGSGGVVSHLSRYFHNFTVQPHAAMHMAMGVLLQHVYEGRTVHERSGTDSGEARVNGATGRNNYRIREHCGLVNHGGVEDSRLCSGGLDG